MQIILTEEEYKLLKENTAIKKELASKARQAMTEFSEEGETFLKNMRGNNFGGYGLPSLENPFLNRLIDALKKFHTAIDNI